MSCTDLVIIADGSFDGSDATSGVGYRIMGLGFSFESGAAFARQVCRSSIEAEVAAMIRGMVMAFRILAKNKDGFEASNLVVRCDCESAVRFMNGEHIKGVSIELIGLRDRVIGWFTGERYGVAFKHLKGPTRRNMKEILPAQYVLMDVDRVAKTFAGYHRFSTERELQESLTFAEDFKLDSCPVNPPALRKMAL